jgi:hypothetical protein
MPQIAVQEVRPLPHLHVKTKMAHPRRDKHKPGFVNPKDIRETELYQENYPGERVYEGGSCAGMPIDRLNRPLATVEGGHMHVAPATIIQEVIPVVSTQEYYTTAPTQYTETTYIETAPVMH